MRPPGHSRAPAFLPRVSESSREPGNVGPTMTPSYGREEPRDLGTHMLVCPIQRTVLIFYGICHQGGTLPPCQQAERLPVGRLAQRRNRSWRALHVFSFLKGLGGKREVPTPHPALLSFPLPSCQLCHAAQVRPKFLDPNLSSRLGFSSSWDRGHILAHSADSFS